MMTNRASALLGLSPPRRLIVQCAIQCHIQPNAEQRKPDEHCLSGARPN